MQMRECAAGSVNVSWVFYTCLSEQRNARGGKLRHGATALGMSTTRYDIASENLHFTPNESSSLARLQQAHPGRRRRIRRCFPAGGKPPSDIPSRRSRTDFGEFGQIELGQLLLRERPENAFPGF